MRQAEKRDFVPRFVPRFALRYPTNRANRHSLGPHGLCVVASLTS